MSSAIQLYQRAYDLDYRKGDWQYAEELYKEIIERYPYSDEKEYAQVHLDRIAKLKSDPHNQELQPVRGSGMASGFAVFCFVISLLLIVGACFLGYFLFQQQKWLNSQELVIQGLISERSGNPDTAREKYTLAQKTYPENILAYQCLAELYLKHGKTKQAELEFNQWQLISPNDLGLKEFKQRFLNAPEGKEEE
jgi:tetratricopeptide (TPR) repeat protein